MNAVNIADLVSVPVAISSLPAASALGQSQQSALPDFAKCVQTAQANYSLRPVSPRTNSSVAPVLSGTKSTTRSNQPNIPLHTANSLSQGTALAEALAIVAPINIPTATVPTTPALPANTAMDSSVAPPPSSAPSPFPILPPIVANGKVPAIVATFPPIQSASTLRSTPDAENTIQAKSPNGQPIHPIDKQSFPIAKSSLLLNPLPALDVTKLPLVPLETVPILPTPSAPQKCNSSVASSGVTSSVSPSSALSAPSGVSAITPQMIDLSITPQTSGEPIAIVLEQLKPLQSTNVLDPNSRVTTKIGVPTAPPLEPFHPIDKVALPTASPTAIPQSLLPSPTITPKLPLTVSIDAHSRVVLQNVDASSSANHPTNQDTPSGHSSSDSSALAQQPVSGPSVNHPSSTSTFSQVLSQVSDPAVKASPGNQAQSQSALPAITAILPNDKPSTPLPLPNSGPQPLPSPSTSAADTPANRFVSDAQLLQSVSHSEMHISLQSDKFGAVELHTRIAGDQVGAAITVEKRDAHAALAAELPALQQALSEKQLRVDQVALFHSAPHTATGDTGAQAQQRDARSAPRQNAVSGSTLSGTTIQSVIADSSGIFDSQGKLSVHA